MMQKIQIAGAFILGLTILVPAQTMAQSTDPCIQMGMVGGAAKAMRDRGMELAAFQAIVGGDQSVNLATRLQYVQLAAEVWKLPATASSNDASEKSVEYCRRLYRPSHR
jgi:hypothetical protein